MKLKELKSIIPHIDKLRIADNLICNPSPLVYDGEYKDYKVMQIVPYIDFKGTENKFTIEIKIEVKLSDKGVE